MDPFSDRQLERYARQLVLPAIGGAGQRALMASRVAVVGAGGVGAGLLPWLAAAGVGRVRLIDDDVVERSNLGRQTLFGEADIGARKAERAARALARINPDCAVEPIAVRLDALNAPDLLRGAALVIDGSDSLATRLVVAGAAHAARVTLVMAAAIGLDGQVATFRGWEPALPCYRCLVGSAPATTARSCAEDGVLGAAVGVVGALAAAEVVGTLAGYGPGLAGRLLLIDLSTMAQRTVALPPDPACPLCSAGGASAR